MTRRAALALALSGLVGCGTGGNVTQEFTRQVPATPAAIVGSAVTTFSNHGFPVAVADEPAGKVRTAPVNLREDLRRARRMTGWPARPLPGIWLAPATQHH